MTSHVILLQGYTATIAFCAGIMDIRARRIPNWFTLPALAGALTLQGMAGGLHALTMSALAEVFDRLIWCLDDNGKELCAVRTEWLHSSNRARVEVALAMAETFPCNNRAEMVSLFDRIVENWPALQSACEEWLDTWDKQRLQS